MVMLGKAKPLQRGFTKHSDWGDIASGPYHAKAGNKANGGNPI